MEGDRTYRFDWLCNRCGHERERHQGQCTQPGCTCDHYREVTR